MKIAVVYYSLEGNTEFISKNIAQAVGADLISLKPVDDVKSGGFMKYFWGGRQVIFGERPKLEKYDNNMSEYDLIFIGTPVWASSYAPALKTFFENEKLVGKKIALYCCFAGSKGKTFSKMIESLKENEIVGEKEFKEPIKNNDEALAMAQEWAKEVLSNI